MSGENRENTLFYSEIPKTINKAAVLLLSWKPLLDLFPVGPDFFLVLSMWDLGFSPWKCKVYFLKNVKILLIHANPSAVPKWSTAFSSVFGVPSSLCAGWLLCWQRWQVLICIKFCAVRSWGLLREPGVSNLFPAVLQGKWWFPRGSVSGSVTHAGAEDPFPTHWDVDSLFPAAHSKPAPSHPMHHGRLEEVGQTPHGMRWIFPRVISRGCQPDVKLRLCSPPTRLVTACLWKWAKPLLLILEITDPQSELSYTRECWE